MHLKRVSRKDAKEGLDGFLFECFGTVERRNSQERELAADAMACNAYGSETFGSGLVRAIWYMNLHDRAIDALSKEFNEKLYAPEPSPEEVRRVNCFPVGAEAYRGQLTFGTSLVLGDFALSLKICGPF